MWAASHPAASGPSPIAAVGEHFAGVGVDHGHLLAVADREEPAAGDVEGQAAGSIAAGERPLGGELVGFGVEADDLALVFDVVEDRSLAIDGGELGLAGQRNGGDNLLRGGVDYGGVLAAAVEGPDGLRGRLKDDGVGVLVPAGMVATVASVARSKTTTALPPPSEM